MVRYQDDVRPFAEEIDVVPFVVDDFLFLGAKECKLDCERTEKYVPRAQTFYLDFKQFILPNFAKYVQMAGNWGSKMTGRMMM